MNKITITSLLFLFSAIVAVPKAIAQTPENPDNTRIEKYEDLTQSDVEPMDSESNMDNMDTEPMDTEPMDTEPMDTEPIDSEPMDSEPMDSQEDMEQLDTRTEETIQEVQPGDMNTNSMYDVRRTEAFNLVSSAYRGDFEEQGINSYAVLIENYQTGDLTAEDLVNAAIDAGDLSPGAIEDESYVQAVDLQLDNLGTSGR